MAIRLKKETIEAWKQFCERVQSSTAVNLNETEAVKDTRIKRALRDYNFFVKTYFPIYADCDCAPFHIELAEEIVLKKRPAKDPNFVGVAEWPREHAKSVHVDVLIPMWMISHKKLTGMILMGKNKADAATLLGDIQAQLQNNALFINDFGEQYQFGSWEDGDFTTKDGIRFVSYGRNQSPRGARKNEKRPNYGAVDDIDDDEIVNNQKRVKQIVGRVMGAMFFALDTRGATLVIAGNRIHNASILAHIVGDTKPGAPKREGIFHSKIYAIDPKTGKPAWNRYTLDQIQSKVKKAGNAIGRKEFFHENHVEGTIFKDKMWNWITLPPLSTYEMIVGYFDPSYEDNATSDFKSVAIWGLRYKNNNEYEKHCIKRFCRRESSTEDAFKFMSKFEDNNPGAGVVWKMEKQFSNKSFIEARKRHNERRKTKGKSKLYIALDERTKEKKYNRMVKMEMDYQDGIVFYNLDEIHNPDMVEGNNQVKGIEPGYNSADDAPDSDEGAWFYLDQHLPGSNFPPIIGEEKERSKW